MDNKNVFIAIALSMSVLLFWGAFFETPKPTETKKFTKQENTNQAEAITPNITEELIIKKISREESINKSKRVIIENNIYSSKNSSNRGWGGGPSGCSTFF